VLQQTSASASATAEVLHTFSHPLLFLLPHFCIGTLSKLSRNGVIIGTGCAGDVGRLASLSVLATCLI
jgi:hypothetical protein